ncbi:hypothetical protein PF003_g17688 [Phytophthora fragariae]|nr:hypothetical protein PF003_g17688 [Phytophthora fragariae]
MPLLLLLLLLPAPLLLLVAELVARKPRHSNQ